MIKVIDYQKIDLTDDEWAAFNNIGLKLGKEEFKGLFTTDERGFITTISPTKPVSWVVMFWAQNVMINQRLREKDATIEELEGRIRKLEERK